MFSHRPPGDDSTSLLGNKHRQQQQDRQIAEDDDAESFVQVIRRYYYTVSDVITQFTTVLTEENQPHNVYFVVQSTIMLFQLLSFAFTPSINFPWNSDATFVVSNIANSVSKFPSSESFRLGEFIFSCSVAVSILLLGVLSAAAHTQLSWTWHLTPTYYIMLQIPNVLFIPVTTALAKLFFGCLAYSPYSQTSNPFYSSITCWSAEHIGFSVLSLFLLATWAWLSFIICHTFVSHRIPIDLNSTDLSATVTGRLAFQDSMARLVLLIIFAGVHNEDGRYALSWLIILFGAVLTYYLITHMPYYADAAQMYTLCRYLLFSLSGLCAFIATLYNDQQSHATLVFYGFIPLLILTSILAVRARYAHIETLTLKDLTEPHHFELVARSLIRQWIRREQDDAQGLYIQNTPERLERKLIMQAATEKVMQDAVARFPNAAFLHAFTGIFYSCVADNRVLAYAGLQLAESRASKFYITFMIYKVRSRLDKDTAQSQSTEVQSYLEFKSRKTLAEAAVVETAKTLVEFWSHLLKPLPDIELLAQQGHVARSAMSKATNHFEKLLQINPNSVPVLRAYGTFALDVLADVAKSVALFDQANEVERNRDGVMRNELLQDDFLQILDTNLDIFDERNGIFSITVDRARLGEIESVNLTARRVLGYSQMNEMVGKNIRIIVPSPYADDHDKYLFDFITNKTGRIINQTRMVFALHKAGHLVPGFLYVRWADAANAKIVGVFQLTGTLNGQSELHMMVDTRNNNVTYCTAATYGAIGVGRRQLMEREVKITDILPDLQECDDSDKAEKRWEQIASRSGLETECRHLITGKMLRAHAWALTSDVRGRKCTFVRIVLANQEEDDAYGEDEDDDESSIMTDVEEAGELGIVASGNNGGPRWNYGGAPRAAGRLNGLGGIRGSLRRHRDFDEEVKNDRGVGGGGNGGIRRDGPNPNIGQNSYSGKAETDPRLALQRRKAKAEDRAGIHAGDGTESVGTSAASGHNKTFNHKRLTKAIYNENRLTSKRLGLMAWYLALLVFLVMGAAIAFHIVSGYYIGFLSEQAERTHISATRVPLLNEIALHVRGLTLMNRHTYPAFTRTGSGTNLTTLVDTGRFLFHEVEESLTLIHDRMVKVSESDYNIVFRTERQQEIYTKPDLLVMLLLRNHRITFGMGLREAVSCLNGVANLAVYSSSLHLNSPDYLPETDRTIIPSTPDKDPIDWQSALGVYVGINNGIHVISASIYEDTTETRYIMVLRGKDLLWIMIAITVFTFLLAVVVLLALVRPILMHIEDQKTQVLDMFLDIPRQTRRAIRRRVYGVYLSVQSESEELQLQHNDAHDTDQVGPHGGHDTDVEFSYLAADAIKGGPGAQRRGMQEDEENFRAGARDVDGWLQGQQANAKQALMKVLRPRQASGINGPSTPAHLAALTKPSAATSSTAALLNTTRLRSVVGLEELNTGDNTNGPLAREHGSLNGSSKIASINIPGVEVLGQGSSTPIGSDQVLTKPGMIKHESQTASLFNRKSLRELLVKFLLFLALIAVYFSVLTFITNIQVGEAARAAITIDYSERRLSATLRSFHATRELVFGNYSYLVANKPNTPTLALGDYRTAARQAIDEATALHHAVVFGDDLNGIPVPKAGSGLTHLMYTNMCTMTNFQSVSRYTPPLPARFMTYCPLHHDGLFRRGLHAAFLKYETDIRALIEGNNVEDTLGALVDQSPSTTPPPTSVIQTMLATINQLDTTLFEYLEPAMQRASAYYLESTKDQLQKIEPTRIGLLTGFLLLLVIAYILVFHPLIRSLNIAARNTRATMLVLPPDVVKSIPSVQQFILDNYQRRD